MCWEFREKSLATKGSVWWSFKLGFKGYLRLGMQKTGRRILQAEEQQEGRQRKYTQAQRMEGRKDKEESRKTSLESNIGGP